MKVSWPLDLAKARLLVTNDDGIYAPGIAALERVARQLSDDVWVVAPENEQSGASHSLTLRRPLRIRELEERRYAIDGTPTDCVLLAVNHILKSEPPAIVLSGFNRGGNLGEDVTYSGTVAAAIEGTMLGVPSIAMSQMVGKPHDREFDVAETLAPDLIRQLCRIGWPRSALINVNFPERTPAQNPRFRVVRQGRRKVGDHISVGRDPRGEPYYWIGWMRTEEGVLPETDIWAINEGYVSITPVDLELTDQATLTRLEEGLA